MPATKELPTKSAVKREPPVEKLPGHWLLAKMGKRVLRPGGMELTQKLLSMLAIDSSDDVVEFAPGLGVTARITLAKNPRTYTAVERDPKAAGQVWRLLDRPEYQCVVGSAEDTGLPEALATALYGEAMLSMQPATAKERILREAFRLLRPGGRYGIHELCLVPNELGEEVRQEMQRELSGEIHVGVRPLTIGEWRELLERVGFVVEEEHLAPMHLLEPARLVRDEGLFRALRFVFNVVRHQEARHRVRRMRRVFRKYSDHLSAIALIARKPEEAMP